jgi:MoaA/NifB/PqqE/SkfB family radical SAM enzyme
MPGSHPCNQIGYGLYITLKGEVVRCPGYIQSLGNVRTEPLKDIWERSQQFSGRFNCGCPPKEGITISSDLYEKVIAGLEKLP